MANKPFAKGNVSATLASDVINTGTFTVAYPTGLVQADLLGSTGGVLAVNANDIYTQAASGAGTFSPAFGASTITITNNSGVTLTAGSTVIVSFGGFNISDSAIQATGAAIANLTAASGTASDTVADVTASFSQTVLNNNFKSISDKLNAALNALRANGLI
jgi:hypothetical protein